MTIYTDGSCLGNPGPGGFGVIVVDNDVVIDAYSDREPRTKDNREEVKGIICALEHYGAKEGDFFVPIVYSDSSYCVNSFNSWINSWKANGWVRAGGKKLENLDLIKIYDMLRQDYKIDLRKIKGHDGELYNELADALATERMTKEEILREYGE